MFRATMTATALAVLSAASVPAAAAPREDPVFAKFDDRTGRFCVLDEYRAAWQTDAEAATPRNTCLNARDWKARGIVFRKPAPAVRVAGS